VRDQEFLGRACHPQGAHAGGSAVCDVEEQGRDLCGGK